MKLSWIRAVAFGCVALAALVQPLATKPCAGREPFVEFLRGLQQSRYGEQALAYLDQIAERPDLPAELRETLDLERSKSLRIAAGEAYDNKQRDARVAEAKRLADKFFAEHPNHPAAASALLNEGDEALLRGQTALAGARAARDEKGSERARAEARAALTEAAAHFDLSTKRLKERVDAQPKSDVAATEPPPPSDLEMAWVESRSKRALVDYLLAQTYSDLKDEARLKLLGQAERAFDAIYQEYRGKANVALLAHLWQGKALAELGQTSEALDAYDEVLVAAPEGELAHPDLAPLFGQAEVFRLQLWGQEAEPKMVIQEGDDWLKLYPHWQATSQYQGVALEVAKARLKAADATRLPAEKVKFNRDAIVALAAIGKVDSEYRNDAILLRREAIGKMGTGGSLSFEEALAMGDEATAERGWSAATSLYRQAVGLVKGKDAKKLETAQGRLAQALHRQAVAEYSAGDMEKALTLCNEIVRDNPKLPVAEEASAVAIAAALQLFSQAKGEGKAAARQRLERVAAYATEHYGDKPAGDDARMSLAQASLLEGNMDGALQRLAEVNNQSKRYPTALQIRGQVRWKQYLDLKRSPMVADKQAELLALRDDAVKSLQAGVERMRAGWQSSSEPMPSSLLETQLLLAETHLEAAQPKEAAELLAPLALAFKATQPTAIELTGQRLLVGVVRANLAIDNIAAAAEAALLLVSLSPDEAQPNSIVVDLGKLASQEIAKREASDDAASASPLAAATNPTLRALRELLVKLLDATDGRKALTIPQLIFLGDASMNNARTDRAREIYQQVLAAIDRDDKAKSAAGAQTTTRIRARLVGLLRNEGKLVEAEKQVDTLIKAHPTALEPLMEKGYILQSLAERDPRRWDDCVKHWTDLRLRLGQSKTRPPEYYDVLYNAALCLVRQAKQTGKVEKAVDARKILSATLTLSPKLNGPETVTKYETLLKSAAELGAAAAPNGKPSP